VFYGTLSEPFLQFYWDIHLSLIIICTSLWIWSQDMIGTNWWKCKHCFEKIKKY